MSVLDQEGEMMGAAGGQRRADEVAGGSRFDMLEDQMNLSRPGLEPAAGEGERRPRHFLHSEQTDVERAAFVEVFHDERHVIERFDADWKSRGHEGTFK